MGGVGRHASWRWASAVSFLTDRRVGLLELHQENALREGEEKEAAAADKAGKAGRRAALPERGSPPSRLREDDARRHRAARQRPGRPPAGADPPRLLAHRRVSGNG